MEEGRADGVLRQGVQDIKGKGRREGGQGTDGQKAKGSEGEGGRADGVRGEGVRGGRAAKIRQPRVLPFINYGPSSLAALLEKVVGSGFRSQTIHSPDSLCPLISRI